MGRTKQADMVKASPRVREGRRIGQEQGVMDGVEKRLFLVVVVGQCPRHPRAEAGPVFYGIALWVLPIVSFPQNIFPHPFFSFHHRAFVPDALLPRQRPSIFE